MYMMKLIHFPVGDMMKLIHFISMWVTRVYTREEEKSGARKK
jgi:hypothetical protein